MGSPKEDARVNVSGPALRVVRHPPRWILKVRKHEECSQPAVLQQTKHTPCHDTRVTANPQLLPGIRLSAAPNPQCIQHILH
jgi:hypothetical protein